MSLQETNVTQCNVFWSDGTMTTCVRFTDGSWECLQSSDGAWGLWSHADCHHTDSLSHTAQKDGEQVAQWYVYWEALDNRKRWWLLLECHNHRQKQNKTWTSTPLSTHAHPRTHTDTHVHSRTAPLHSHHSKENKNLQQCTGQDGITVSTSSFLHGKIHSCTYMREIFFLGTAKAIRCLSQQQRIMIKIKTFYTFLKPSAAQMDWMFTLDSRWEHPLFAASRGASKRPHSQQGWR